MWAQEESEFHACIAVKIIDSQHAPPTGASVGKTIPSFGGGVQGTAKDALKAHGYSCESVWGVLDGRGGCPCTAGDRVPAAGEWF